MPELPEVETVARSLKDAVVGLRTETLTILRSGIFLSPPETFGKHMQGQTVRSVSRKGKYILFRFGNGCLLVAHLRMTGKFVLAEAGTKRHPHDRLFFGLNDGRRLIFNDMRCFGTLLVRETNAPLPEGLAKLGPEPFDERFDVDYLVGELKKTQRSVKDLLLDQTKIAGLGNIYAAEILFRSGIRPTKACNRIKRPQARKIRDSTRRILKEAIDKNGTTISDFRRVDEKTGEFQNFLKVYGREGLPCKVCSSPILRVKQSQRSTFFCGECQKE